MKARSTVNALLAVAEQLIAAKKAARSKRAASDNAAPGSKASKLLTETRPLLLRLTTQPVS